MTRLQAELQRLYGSLPAPPSDADANGNKGLRAAVLELSDPADWQAMGQLWRGVQADLGLPAPAIAVNGRNGYQLWFSFAHPLPASRAAAFLEGLRRRYLGDLPAARLTCLPARAGADAAALSLPPQQLTPERWSAFVAPDLAPVFAEEPWLDTAPGMDGQADLLARLQSITGAELGAALQGLGGVPAAALPVEGAAGAADSATDTPMQQASGFLLAVMKDESVALALRIEAAKALLLTCCCCRSPRP
ncbi:hypothetical protein [Paucibacter soli]|uniref:hypothetical protein n=1 Tax=Paucibacter soli TaxID=3133433 RepID=UPI0030A948E9